MNCNIKVSVIIPIYNAESYIDDCLISVCNQTYRCLEVIMVNDGSQDKSLDICKKYQAKYSQLMPMRIITQENQGEAAARYTGLCEAIGEYIIYVDADDIIELDYVEAYMSYAGKADLITGGLKREEKSGVVTIRRDGIPGGVYNGNKMSYIYDNMVYYDESYSPGILTYCVAKLYRADLLRKVFNTKPERLAVEADTVFVWSYLLKCHSIYITDINKYYYRYHGESAFHKAQTHYLGTIDKFYNKMHAILVEGGCSRRLLSKFEKYVCEYIINAPKHMGFSWENYILQYIYPYINQFKGKRVVLYGAGDVGISYYKVLSNISGINIYWTDTHYETLSVNNTLLHPVEGILSFNSDYILIAVVNESVAKDIKTDLISKGIDSENILWSKPICV